MGSGVTCAVCGKELTEDEMSDWLEEGSGPIAGPNPRPEWVDAPTHVNCREEN